MTCDCGMSWMKNFGPLSGSVTCSSPSNVAGQTIDSLSYVDLGCVTPSVNPVRRNIVAYEGEIGTELSCNVSGDPLPQLSWYFMGEKLTENLFYRLATNGSLFIVAMRPQLAGNYSCNAENVIGATSQTVTLVYGGTRLPIFKQVPLAVHAFVGDSFMLPCQADEVTDHYSWYKDGRDITEDSSFTIQAGLGLFVSSASKNNSGTYTCVAINEMGAANASAEVHITSSVVTCEGVLEPSIMEGLQEKVDIAFNLTQQELRSSNSPSSLLRKLRFPNSGIIEHLKAAEIFDQAVKRIRDQLIRNGTVVSDHGILDLSSCELEVLGVLSGCEEHRKQAQCSSCFHRQYRSLDGTCNNLDYPLQGAANIPFKRLLKPSYEDGVGLPLGWFGGKPSARLISSKIIATKEVQGSSDFTLMLMQIGQFLDHDLDLAPVSPSNIAFDTNNPTALSSCSSICHNDAPCFPIPVPENDTRINRECISFTRSSAVCGTGAPSVLLGSKHILREQINSLSSYVDGSMVYSSIESTAEKIREPRTGKLREGIRLAPMARPLLPFDNDTLIECSTGIHSNRSKCFLGGDMRTNEQVGLTTMHTIFMREHNRIADILLDLNPHWNAEKLYQETRKILVAEWQHIVYSEYLPKILGHNYLKEYRGYKPNVDASIANGFATAAYRFGHSQIMPLFQRLDSDYNPLPTGPLRLQDAFFAPFRIVEEGGIEPLIRGLLASPVKMRVSHQGLNNNLTEALFKQAHEIGLDLAAFNIQRGRDHGLPSYIQWRAFCNLTTPSSIEGLSEDISNGSTRALLREVYGDDPDNIDLWVGGLLEDVVPGAQLGPTFLCIIGDQFQRLRSGDRFYYEREGQFTPDQLVQIRQASLSRLICDNADDVHKVPADSFVLQDPAHFTPCNQLPTADLFLWKEYTEDCRVPSFRARRSTLYKTPPNLEELSARISDLEKKVNTCNYNGSVYESNQSWSISKCFQCVCQLGVTKCTDTCV